MRSSVVSRRSVRSITGLLVSAAAVVSIGVGSAASGHGRTDHRATPAAPLVESRDCRPTPHADDDHDRDHDRGHDTHDRRRPAGSLGTTTQTIAVTIPRTTSLRVDAAGRVTEAATNTGCAPAPGDLVYLHHPDGTITLDTSFDLGARTWVGDFRRPGRFQPQGGR